MGPPGPPPPPPSPPGRVPTVLGMIRSKSDEYRYPFGTAAQARAIRGALSFLPPVPPPPSPSPLRSRHSAEMLNARGRSYHYR